MDLLQNLDLRPLRVLAYLGRSTVPLRLRSRELQGDWGCSGVRSAARSVVPTSEAHSLVRHRTVQTGAETPIEAVPPAAETRARYVHIDFRERLVGRQAGLGEYMQGEYMQGGCPDRQ